MGEMLSTTVRINIGQKNFRARAITQLRKTG